MSDSVLWYDAHAGEVAARYESMDPESIHDWLIDMLPKAPALVLDVGAGSGRDAAWLASRGFEVVAVEPSAAMRAEAQRFHPGSSIRWIADSLPGLDHTIRLGLSFDLILMSAVWMHLPPGDRPRAFRKLITLLKPGGLIAITLRDGPADEIRGMYRVSKAEVERLARDHGAYVEKAPESEDKNGRSELRWTLVVIRLPDDGTGALPLLRHIILNDDKASTYKLALLRALCRIADGASGCARDAGEERVAIPLGLVALYWIRLFKPLLAASLPQSPNNMGDQRLGFVKAPYRRLSDVSHLDLRTGMSFATDRTMALHGALQDASNTICRMPAHYITYSDGNPILISKQMARGSVPNMICLNEAYFFSFGELLVPRNLWRVLQRFDVWIEPALVAEWSRLMHGYAESQGRVLVGDAVARAMKWSEPGRDVGIAREQASRLIDHSKVYCAWTGRQLSISTLDIDHCFPWATWPCDDLWNLLPAHQRVNRNEKRDRLPTDALLRASQDRIQAWWEAAYVGSGSRALLERFEAEARTTLPNISGTQFGLDDVFAGVSLQRLRLKHDQQVPEWPGKPSYS